MQQVTWLHKPHAANSLNKFMNISFAPIRCPNKHMIAAGTNHMQLTRYKFMNI